MISASAPGKVIITGEHAVVYGYPALVATIEKKCQVSLTSGSGQLKGGGWLAKKAFNHLDLKKVNLKVENQVPQKSGLGSSAALAVSLSAAVFKLKNPGKKLDYDWINKNAFEVEKLAHGQPSGADNTVVTYGGVIKFKKTTTGYDFKKIKLPGFLEVFLVDTGEPKEDTQKMVSLVANQMQKKQQVISQIGKTSQEIIDQFSQSGLKRVSALIQKNQRLLEQLEVVGQKAKDLVSKIESWGGVAKITGAGGLKSGSGYLLAWHPSSRVLAKKLEQTKTSFFKTKVGLKGVNVG